MIKIIDLFCGIGGLTNGLISSGLNVVAGVDFDESCKFAYETNNDSVFIGKSILDVTGEELLPYFTDEDIKVIVGCAPCQPFSNHQKNKFDRSNHKDWGMLYEFLRLVKEVEPDIVSMENVPSLAKQEVFIDFVKGLEDEGYSVTFQVHNSANYGVAQRRNRLLLLASKLGEIHFSEDVERPISVREVIGGLPSIEAGEQDPTDILHKASRLSDLNLQRIIASKQNGTWDDWPTELLLDCYKKDSGQSYKSVYGRMGWEEVAPTLTTQFYSYGTGRFGHPDQNRAISLREGALLQSFPLDYQFVEGDSKVVTRTVARQIGNAVPPRLGLHIGRSIINHLEQENNDERR